MAPRASSRLKVCAVAKAYLDSRARLGFPMAPKAHADEVLAELAKAAEQQNKKAA